MIIQAHQFITFLFSSMTEKKNEFNHEIWLNQWNMNDNSEKIRNDKKPKLFRMFLNSMNSKY